MRSLSPIRELFFAVFTRFSISSFSFSSGGNDPELVAIMRKLREYGIVPTGNKSNDKATLYRIEIEKAKQENVVTGKFLTITKGQEEKIQENKKAKRKEITPENNSNSEKAQKQEKAMKTMGEQIYLAIKMKQKRKT